MSEPPPTRVYLTVDVECAEERLHHGRLQPPLDYDLRVWGRFRNQADELGLTFIAKQLERYELKATFFVEALGARFFGEAGLGEICQFLRARGHDLQLHLHPGLRQPDFISRGLPPESDDLADYDLDRQTALLREGLEVLQQCGQPAAGLTAFRAGNFGASNQTWQAVRTAGLKLSSNLNPGYLERGCRIRWISPPPALFEPLPGLWELPISSFAEQRGYRHLQLSAVSYPELRAYLLAARRLGLAAVTLVTHPFEFFWTDAVHARQGRPNLLNRRRLRQLCAFLRDRPGEFRVETVGALAQRLVAGRPAPDQPSRIVALRGNRVHRYHRWLEQAYKRLEERAAPRG